MTAGRDILKIGAAIIMHNRLLVVRKHGGSVFILPGGKPEPVDADDRATLMRELREELACTIDQHQFRLLGEFHDRAADIAATVTVRLYETKLASAPHASSEIEELHWLDAGDNFDALAPSIRNHILPFLMKNGRLAWERQRALCWA